jgi:hypothetical protein
MYKETEEMYKDMYSAILGFLLYHFKDAITYQVTKIFTLIRWYFSSYTPILTQKFFSGRKAMISFFNLQDMPGSQHSYQASFNAQQAAMRSQFVGSGGPQIPGLMTPSQQAGNFFDFI